VALALEVVETVLTRYVVPRPSSSLELPMGMLVACRSADNGVHWELATVERKEKPTPHGMDWCWVWWTFDLKVADLIGYQAIMCRAWDESQQPSTHESNVESHGHGQQSSLLG
jgi:hypothetical protein